MDRDEPMAERSARRRGRVLAGVGLVALALVVTWRSTSLRGLPDIGDPFDVAAYVSAKISDEANAFVLYYQALARRVGNEPARLIASWAQADPAERRWLAENREALDLWKRGSERPDAVNVLAADLTTETNLEDARGLRSLQRMGLLEASRREAEGDLAGSWEWYRAALRCSRHLGRRGTLIERIVGIAIHREAAAKARVWATNPEVDADLLRRALADVLAIDRMTPPNSDAIKSEYIVFTNSINDPQRFDRALLATEKGPSWANPGVQRSMDTLSRVLRSEPERSRRVIRLIFSNWLAYCDRPPSQRPPMVALGPLLAANPTGSPLTELYAVDASAPPSARALAAEDLARWTETAKYARMMLPAYSGVRMALARERAEHAGLVVALAREIYLRDHGDYPGADKDLVGPYLQAIPEGYNPPR